MKFPSSLRRILAVTAMLAAGLMTATRADAQLADLADVPLANSPSNAVLPNLMYILDDSGSMNFNWMPDQIQRDSATRTYYHCKKCLQRTVSSMSSSAD